MQQVVRRSRMESSFWKSWHLYSIYRLESSIYASCLPGLLGGSRCDETRSCPVCAEEGQAVLQAGAITCDPLPIYLSIYPSTYPSIYQSIYLFAYLPIYLSIHLCVYVYIHIFIDAQSIHLIHTYMIIYAYTHTLKNYQYTFEA